MLILHYEGPWPTGRTIIQQTSFRLAGVSWRRHNDRPHLRLMRRVRIRAAIRVDYIFFIDATFYGSSPRSPPPASLPSHKTVSRRNESLPHRQAFLSSLMLRGAGRESCELDADSFSSALPHKRLRLRTILRQALLKFLHTCNSASVVALLRHYTVTYRSWRHMSRIRVLSV